MMEAASVLLLSVVVLVAVGLGFLLQRSLSDRKLGDANARAARIIEDAVPGTLDLSLTNVGFGPGTVRDLIFHVDGDPIPATDLEACKEVARRIGRASDADWDTRCFVSRRDYVLRPGDTITIFSSRPTAARAAEDHSAELVDYRRLAATATYCSFYEDCWQLARE